MRKKGLTPIFIQNHKGTQNPKFESLNMMSQNPVYVLYTEIATNLPKIAGVNGRLALCRQNYNLHNVLFLIEYNIVKL